MNNKIVLKKTTSAIFLAFVLVVGTFALSIPSFMIGAAQASSDREKDHDNGDKKSYGKDRDRDDKSRDHDKYDNDDKKSYGKDRDRDDKSRDHDKYDNDDEKSYGKDRDRDDKSRDHTDDNNEYDYESTKYSEYVDKRYNSYERDYGMDNDYKDHYGKDSYESQYSSYGKDNNNYKSKDSSSKSVSIKKVKCNNINVNLNGIDADIGGASNGNGPIAEAQETDDEGLETNSFGSDSGGSNYGRDGQSDSDTDLFVCKNNNNNTVVVVNETIPEPTPEPTITCEECFTQVLNATELERFLEEAFTPTGTIEQACIVFSSGLVTEEALRDVLELVLTEREDRIDNIIECLLEAGIEFSPPET